MAVDKADPAKLLSLLMSGMNEQELSETTSRNATTRAERIARGDHMGVTPYGYKHVKETGTGRILLVRDEDVDLDLIRRAYVETGTVAGACRWLGQHGIPTRRGLGAWRPQTIYRMVEREWPELLPPKTRTAKRRRQPTTFLAGPPSATAARP